MTESKKPQGIAGAWAWIKGQPDVLPLLPLLLAVYIFIGAPIDVLQWSLRRIHRWRTGSKEHSTL